MQPDSADLFEPPPHRGVVRTLLRQIWFHVIVWPLLTLITTYSVLTIRYHTGHVAITRNFAAERNAPVLATPEDQRAWTHYRRACLALTPIPIELRDRWGIIRPAHPSWPGVAAYLSENAPVLDQIREATRLPTFGAITTDQPDSALLDGGDPGAPPPGPPAGNPPLLDLLYHSLGKARALVRVLREDAYLAAASGDARRAHDDLTSLCRLARQLAPARANLIEQLVALAALASACDATTELLVDAPGLMDDALLASLHAEIARTLGALTPISLDPESDFADDFAQRVFTDDGSGDGYINAEGHANMLAFGHSSMDLENRLFGPFLSIMTGRREYTTLRDQAFDAARLHASAPLWQRQGRLADRFEALAGARADRAIFAPIVLLGPAMDKAIHAQDQISTVSGATLAAISLHRYRARHDSYPDSPGPLIAEFTASPWPTDPFDGAPLRYRLIEGWPVLYSIGNNHTDDGGALPPSKPLDAFLNSTPVDGDWILFPPIDTDDSNLVTTPGPWPAVRRAAPPPSH